MSCSRGAVAITYQVDDSGVTGIEGRRAVITGAGRGCERRCAGDQRHFTRGAGHRDGADSVRRGQSGAIRSAA